MVNAGENVHFSVNSEKGKVHLTGYFLADMMGACGHDHEHGEDEEHAHGDLEGLFEDESDSDDDDDEDDEDDDDDDEGESDEEEEEVQNGKRKAIDSAKSDQSADKNGAKKLKEEIPKLVPNKVRLII